MLEFREFPRAHQVFDEMLEGAFIRVLTMKGEVNCLVWVERMTSIWT